LRGGGGKNILSTQNMSRTREEGAGESFLRILRQMIHPHLRKKKKGKGCFFCSRSGERAAIRSQAQNRGGCDKLLNHEKKGDYSQPDQWGKSGPKTTWEYASKIIDINTLYLGGREKECPLLRKAGERQRGTSDVHELLLLLCGVRPYLLLEGGAGAVPFLLPGTKEATDNCRSGEGERLDRPSIL